MIGKTLGKYKIVDLLGRGGMAEVYRAYQANLERNVALKLIKTSIADNPDSLARFEREAKSAAALRHPNIVQIYDFDIEAESGRPYMVMELIEGGSLADDLEKRAASGTPSPGAHAKSRDAGRNSAYHGRSGRGLVMPISMA